MKDPKLNRKGVEQEVKGQQDGEFEQKVRKVMANDALFQKVLDATRKTFTEIYGEEPDQEGGLWKWYVTEQFDANLRLAVTSTVQGGKA